MTERGAREWRERRAPRAAIPWQAAYAWALLDEGASALTGGTPRATLAGVRISRRRQWYEVGKAVGELGLPQTPLEAAFGEAVGWVLGE